MNKNVRRIATQTLSKVTAGKQIDMTNLESTIDAYVLAVISATVNEGAAINITLWSIQYNNSQIA